MRFDQQSISALNESSVDYEVLAEHVRDMYRDVAPQYRRDDELEITTDFHRRLAGILGSLTASFGRSITVLDVGCGTGRYFHCLTNVRRLEGIDVSQDMLDVARNPVREEQITIEQIQLTCENAYLARFPRGSFDFIYSLGMFGYGCPVTVGICNHLYDWLAPGGQLFFNTISNASDPFFRRLRRNIRVKVYPVLPRRIQNLFAAREAGLPFFGLSENELRAILRATHFKHFTVSTEGCHSQLWNGIHLECHATKSRGLDQQA